MSVPRTPGDLHAEHELERARVHELERREQAIIARETARHSRRAAALAPPPGYLVEDPDFPGCLFDQAPYPYLGETA